ncbi:PSD1 and planctomycete cytochrome C domain-containing protein [Prosthecobacter sp.]|uniref:PSD1 and planctomycete cytochrome C domain-containing protein n=1 Tax=Prosthecobacter sp. TaxID=1965333 RepID=UPI003784EDBF
MNLKSSLVSSTLALIGLIPASLCRAEISFSRDIRPILSENCISCHGPDDKGRKGGLRLDLESHAKASHEGSVAVNPGNPGQSTLIQRIESTDPDEKMPPLKLHKTIPQQQVALLKEWILQGAPWGGHWAYEPVKRPPVPLNNGGTPIDAFLASRLQRENLTFSPQADKTVLIRRLSLDITGLPPTLRELAQLLPLPHDKIVAYYLAKPAYGEHWARQWLDLARYADSAGYPSDPPREIWSYRDWVVRALNTNMGFDQFTIEQIAGDLLPNPTKDQLIATAFHRNTMTNNEGGTNDEEFRVAAVIDRVNTTFAVWMGTTMACAQCHTHKYDPITINEYYQAYAFFNQSADADKKDESPVLELIPPDIKTLREALKKKKAALESAFARPKPQYLAGLEQWLKSGQKVDPEKFPAIKKALAIPSHERSPDQESIIRRHYALRVSEAAREIRAQLESLEAQLNATKPTTVPVMMDLAGEKRRKTQVQLRGNWQALGDEVQEGVPAVFPALPPDAPRNRLGLARWLVSKDNPMTARVAVNRMWEAVFGIGIVRTSEEFGSQGEMPLHPELLDWLAAEFMESNWDVKHMLTLIFNSRAYRQDSRSTPALDERDPENRLLTRGPRFRPGAEVLRDQALLVSGLLNLKMGGIPVRPLAPKTGLGVAFGGQGSDWQISEGGDQHRRSIYTDTRRNSPYASFSIFDAPSREVCTLRRGRSNTPLQAFVTLNDPVFVEAAQSLARRLVAESGDTASRLHLAWKLCLTREPDAQDTRTLSSVYEEALALYRSNPALASQITADPHHRGYKASFAAWTAVANVLMNLDEFIMRL